jgi:hypothetical protein
VGDQNDPALVIAQVQVAPAAIQRHVVVAVAGQAAQAGIAEEGIAAGRVGDQAKIFFEPR